jgi:putative SOS response-associated peptidase YedK
MCGRYTLHSLIGELQQHFGLFDGLDFRPSYNITPSQRVPVVRTHDGARELASCQWGLVPHWVKGTPRQRPINARGETVAEKPFFRNAFRNRRCLIPANGFYEWKRDGVRKQPYFFHLEDRDLFAFAGLWESREGEDGPSQTCAIITTSASAVMRPVHDRMPVILDPDQYDGWLLDGRKDLLDAYAGPLVCHPVGLRVNSPANNDAELLMPVPVLGAPGQ